MSGPDYTRAVVTEKRRLPIDWLLFGGICAIALAFRLAFINQVRDLAVFQYPISDAKSYYDWAGRLAAGDWWGDQVFYQAPLYPYFIGLIRAWISDDLFVIRAIQSVIGALSCGLLFGAGRWFFDHSVGRSIGLVAGLLLATHAPAIFFDGILQKTVIVTLLICGLLALLAWTQARPIWGKWLAIGTVLGLLCLARENALLYVFVLPAWALIRFRNEPRTRRVQWIGSFALGLGLILLPVGYRNHNVGGGFALTTSQMGSNFYIGNNPKCNGSYVPLREGREDPMFERTDATELAEQAMGRSLLPNEVSDYWMQQSWAYMSSQPVDWLRLQGLKWLLVWNACEIADSQDYYLLAEYSSVLNALGRINHFGLVFPLASMGVVLTWSRRRDLWLLYALILTMAVGVAAFFVFARYRFPIVPMLILFAAAGFVQGLSTLRQRQWRRVAPAVAVMVAGLIMANLSLFDRRAQRISALFNFGFAASELGRYDEAIQYCEHVLADSPGYARAMYLLGLTYERQGHSEKAERQYRQTLRQDPKNTSSLNNLGLLLANQGKVDQARTFLQQLVQVDPSNAEAHNNLGIVLSALNQPVEAQAHCRRAIELKPDYATAYSNLGAILNRAGEFAEAVEVLTQAVELDPNLSGAWFNLAVALDRTDRGPEAERHYRRAIELDPNDEKSYRILILNLAGREKSADVAAVLAAADRAGLVTVDWIVRTVKELLDRQLKPAAIQVLEHAQRRYPNEPAFPKALQALP